METVNWNAVDWRKRDCEISREIGVSRQRVNQKRHAILNPKDRSVCGLDQAVFDHAMNYIRANYADPTFSLYTLAKQCHLSPFYFHRVFKKKAGRTFKQIASELQVNRAKELIEQGCPLSEISAKCGFSGQSHFCARFKQLTGKRPLQFRRERLIERASKQVAA